MNDKKEYFDLLKSNGLMIKTELELTEDFFSLLLSNEEMKKKGFLVSSQKKFITA